jgi:hypothetical protein
MTDPIVRLPLRFLGFDSLADALGLRVPKGRTAALAPRPRRAFWSDRAERVRLAGAFAAFVLVVRKPFILRISARLIPGRSPVYSCQGPFPGRKNADPTHAESAFHVGDYSSMPSTIRVA